MKRISLRKITGIVKADGFHAVQIRDDSGRKTSQGTQYVKKETEVLPRPVEFCGKENIMFHQKQQSA